MRSLATLNVVLRKQVGQRSGLVHIGRGIQMLALLYVQNY